MNFINRISRAIKNNEQSHGRWAAHLAMILCFSVIAIGYLVYNSTQFELAKAQTQEMVFSSPQANDIWYFGEDEEIRLEGIMESRPSETFDLYLFACMDEYDSNDEWYSIDGNWGYRQKITIDNSLIAVDETDFVLNVVVPSGNKLFTNTRADGNDIVFVANDHTTKLDHEIEEFDQTTEVGVFRVEVPSIFADTITNIYMYYDNSSAPVQENPTGVYDGQHPYGAFYEMDITGNDSTENDRNISGVIGDPELDSSTVGSSIIFDGNDGWDMANIGYWEEEWSIRTHNVVFRTGLDTSTLQTILAEGGSSNGMSIYMRNNRIYARWWSETQGWNGDYIVTDRSAPGISINGTISPNTVYYLTASYEYPGNYRLFVNGIEQFGPDGLDDNSTSVVINAHSGDGGIAYTGATSKDFDNGTFTGQNLMGGIAQVEIIDEFWEIDNHTTWYNSLNDGFINFSSQENKAPSGCFSPVIHKDTITTNPLGQFIYSYNWEAGYLDGERIEEDLSDNNVKLMALIPLGGFPFPTFLMATSDNFSIVDTLAEFSVPAGGEEWYFGEVRTISISGSYGKDVKDNGPFTVSFDVCLEDSSICYSEIINDITIDPASLNGQFQFDVNWINVGYQPDGITRIPGNLNNNVYLKANISQSSAPFQHYGSYDSNLFSIVDGDITINVVDPEDETIWHIGDKVAIIWTNNTTGGEDPDHFNIYYSEHEGEINSWKSVISNIPYSGQTQSIDWEEVPIMEDDTVGLKQFMIKVEAYDSTNEIITSAVSEAFTIDYGPVHTLEVSSVAETAINMPFTISALVKDHYGNIITNFSNPLTINIAPLAQLDPNTLGNGTTSGVWENGMVTFNNYTISAAGVYELTLIEELSQISFMHPIDVLENAVYIDEPTTGTIWYVNGEGNIIFRAGGAIQPDYLKIFYSEAEVSGNKVWVEIKSSEPYSEEQPQVYIWEIPDTINTPQHDIAIKVESWEGGGTEPIATGISEEFTLRSGGEAEGTYITQEFIIDEDPAVYITSLDGFEAIADADASSDMEATLDISVRFIKADGSYFGPISDGFYDLEFNEDFASLLYKFRDFDNEQIRKIQFRVKMWTSDIALYRPWVESMRFDYEVRTSEEDVIGTLRFDPDGDNHKSVNQGSSVNYGIVFSPRAEHRDMAYKIQFELDVADSIVDDLNNIVPIEGVEITANPNIITFNGSESYTSLITLTADDIATVANDIPFYIRVLVTEPDRPDLVAMPNPLTGYLDVGGITPTDDFSISISGASDKEVRPGNTVSYNIAVSFINNFDESIVLSTDIEDVFDSGVIESVSFIPSAIVYPVGNQVIVMRVTVDDNADEYDETEFNIIATPEEANAKVLAPKPSLTISNDAQAYINIEATAEIEGGTSSDRLYPKFSFRLYPDNANDSSDWSINLDDLVASTIDGSEVTVDIEFSTDEVVDGETYIGYLRSDRHLWRKATSPNSGEIAIDLNELNYVLNFPKLLSGDIAPSATGEIDIINTGDFLRWNQDFNKLIAGLLPDLNNDGKVNTLDVMFMFNNWFKTSELPGN